MKKQIKITISSLLFSIGLLAQAPVRHYATQAHMARVLTPEYRAKQSEIERHTAAFMAYGSIDSSVVLPVVFHLLPLPEGAVPITEADIARQMAQLNADFFTPEHPYLDGAYQQPALVFDGTGAVVGNETDLLPYLAVADGKENFAGKAATALIQFCFPLYDPQGQPTTGIITPGGTPQVWSLDDLVKSGDSGGSSPWPVSDYINVWVGRLNDSISGGYAQMPGGPMEHEGIVLDDRFFARATAKTTYDKGRTLSHLMGSYLNLYELWNDTQPCVDDYVEDTPIHNAPNQDLGHYAYKHISTCDGNPVEMVSNIMDNAPDSLQYLFTHGQAMRMQAAVAEEGPRFKLRATPLTCSKIEIGGRSTNDDTSVNDGLTTNWQMRVNPNPADDQFEIQLAPVASGKALTGELQIMIYGTTGNLVWQQRQGLTEQTIVQIPVRVSGWVPGTYSIVSVINGVSQTNRVVIR
jgi:hypothetical protein